MTEDLDVLSYLTSKGIFVKTVSQDNVAVPCFFHDEDPGKRGRLYIDVSSTERAGLYFCHVCGESGNLRLLLRHFGDEDKMPGSERFVKGEKHFEILAAAAKYYHDNLLTTEHLPEVKWLTGERGLTNTTILSHKLGWADGELHRHLRELGYEYEEMKTTGLVVETKESEQADGTFVLDGGEKRYYDFLRNCITIPYRTSGHVSLIRGKKIGEKYLTPRGQGKQLFNSAATFDADRVVVTEGEFDAMIVEQMGYSAVAVPGATMWDDSWNSYFKVMRRVYLAYDNDVAGQTGAKALQEKLGRKSRIIVMPDGGLPPGQNDISEYFGKQKADPDEFARMLAAADKAGTLLITVDEAWDEWKELQGKQGLMYGLGEFDDYMTGGHLDGQVWVVLAKTNVGKTLFLLNTFHRLTMVPGQADAKVLFVSLEQTRGDWFERSRRIWNFYNLESPRQAVNKSSADYWRDRILLTDVNRMMTEDLIGAIDDFTDHTGSKPDLVAVDYLGYWARSFKGVSKYEQVSEAVMSLKEVAKERRVRILAPHQVSRSQDFGQELDVDSGRDSGAIEETADSVFLLWNPDTKPGVGVADKTGRISLKIGKTRAGGKGQVAKFQFGYLSLAMVPLQDVALCEMAAHEIGYEALWEKWDDVEPWEVAMFRHKTGMTEARSDQIRKAMMDFGS